jgi:hypothetical protein
MENYDSVNCARAPLAPGESWTEYHDVLGFTRMFYGAEANVPLTIEVWYSMQQVTPDGLYVTDESLPLLRYNIFGRRHKYDPERHEQTCKFFEIVHGRWLRLSIKNDGDKLLDLCDINVCPSVF